MRKVFLSSTGLDLTDYWEAAYKAIEGLDGYHCVRMEDFGARDWESDGFCRAKVSECDIYVGILGEYYGSCPPGSAESYTKREYEVARQAGLPCLVFLSEPGSVPSPSGQTQTEREAAGLQGGR